MKIELYQKLLKNNEENFKKIISRSNFISYLRLLNVVVIIALFFLAYYFQNDNFSIVALLAILPFIYLVKKNNHINKIQNFYLAEKDILTKYTQRFNDEWQSFPDTGSEFLQEGFPQANDLDIFGKCSLYQYINVANTSFGREHLANQLQNCKPNKNAITKYQKAVEELANKQTFSLKMQTLTELLKKQTTPKQTEQIIKFINNSEKNKQEVSIIQKAFLYLFPIVTITFILLSLFNISNNLFSSIATFCIIIQLILYVIKLQSSNNILFPIYNFNKNISIYKSIFEAMQKEDFCSEALKQLQEQVSFENDALKSFKQLNILGEAIDLRYNAIATLIFNCILLWDYQCINRYAQWQKKYSLKIIPWLKVIGELEMLMSLSVLANVKTDYEFPTVVESTNPFIEFTNIKHPLLIENQAISNSLTIPTATVLITGSNMSGKTTFMRSIGLNLILAYAGAPVMAKNFSTSCMQIFTSMRIEDSVSKGMSSFYAELLRLKNIVDYNQKQLPMISLIDEIFKGTNSADRIICATKIIKQLSTPWSITIITTHDFELCDLENDSNIKAKNYHFSEYYIDNKINFDYKIKPERCKTTNAQQLLKMVGI